MPRTTQREILDVINAGIDAKMSIMIEGDPGQGKSALVRSIAEERGCRLISIIGSQRDSTDITGYPVKKSVVVNTGGRKEKVATVADFAIQKWQWEIMNYRKVLLFLDEFSNSPPPVQASMLSLLNERTFPNGDVMPDETIVIGAMNPVDSAANGFRLGLPVSNRLLLVPWNPSPKEWMESMLTNWGHGGNGLLPREMEWRKIVVSFLSKHPDLLYKLPDEDMKNDPSMYGIDQASHAERDIYTMAYPSNRSWTNLARVLAALHGNNRLSKRTMQRTADGIIGYEAASEFVTYATGMLNRRKPLPPTSSIIDDPSIVDWDSLDAAQARKVFSESMQQLRNNDSLLEKIVGMFVYAADRRTDIGAPYVSELIHISSTKRRSDLVDKVMNAYRDVGVRLAGR